MNQLKIAFAGNRDVSVKIFDFILKQGVKPLALFLPDDKRGSHNQELLKTASFIHPSYILKGNSFRKSENINLLKNLDLDYIICIHFPYIVPEEVLAIPRIGVLNLHPAFLPFNRGWHTPTWAILENTPVGATLHFMDKGIDTGDIIYQEQLEILPDDTANTLYKRVNELEVIVFKKAWGLLLSGSFQGKKQYVDDGTIHKCEELFSPTIQEINLNLPVKPVDLILRLRALTTNKIEEAAYFDIGEKRYRVQVSIYEESIKK